MVPSVTYWQSGFLMPRSQWQKWQRLKPTIWLALFFLALGWSAWRPHDYPTWWLEVLPALVVLIVIFFTRERFPLTPLAYWLILIHSVILMVGGHYTYAEVPVGDWVRDLTGGDRNNYDKLGHLAQGFVPAIVVREILVRNCVVAKRSWLAVIVVSICLAFSAFYELVEWWVALLSAEAAESFLGTQGYVWDTQSDMFLALLGAVLALLILSRIHDRQIRIVSG
jgi:putative membrane protein